MKVSVFSLLPVIGIMLLSGQGNAQLPQRVLKADLLPGITKQIPKRKFLKAVPRRRYLLRTLPTAKKIARALGVSGFREPKYAAIVMDAQSGQIIHGHDPHELRHPASLTKMMTLYMLFKAIREKKIKFTTLVPVSFHASKQMPGKIGLKPGNYISVKDAALAMITKSANDAAAAIGEVLGGGSEVNFARQMNQVARSLGMKNTYFRNASGVPDPLQVSTAYDMALLSKALYRDFPEHYALFSTTDFAYKGSIYKNHNRLLGKVQGVDGIKTGYTCASGFNLAASAMREMPNNQRRRLIVVVMGGKTTHWRDKRVTELLESYFPSPAKTLKKDIMRSFSKFPQLPKFQDFNL